MRNENHKLVRLADGRWKLTFTEADHRVEFVAKDNPRRLFMTTQVAMYVDGRLHGEADSWRCEYRFEFPEHLDKALQGVTYEFGYHTGSSFSLRWKRFERGRYHSGGALPICHAGTSSACLTLITVWAVVWYAWVLPMLFT